MAYNGLEKDLSLLSKFVFIYEKRIKSLEKQADFMTAFSHANELYEQSIKPYVSHSKIKKLILDPHKDKKYTLRFTKKYAQILSFCCHLRNSFVHGLLIKCGNKLQIKDENRHKTTSSDGYLDYKTVRNFLLAIIDEYEEYGFQTDCSSSKEKA